MKFQWSEKDYPLTNDNCMRNQEKCAFNIQIDDVKTELENHHYAVLGNLSLCVEDITLDAVIVAECFFTVVDGDTEPATYLAECVDLTERDIQVLAPWLTF